MANDPTLSILSFDLNIGLGRTHRYITNSSFIAHRFGFGLSYHRFNYEALHVEQLLDGRLNATVTLSLNDSVIDSSSLATAGVGEVPTLHNDGLATHLTPIRSRGLVRSNWLFHFLGGAAVHFGCRGPWVGYPCAQSGGLQQN